MAGTAIQCCSAYLMALWVCGLESWAPVNDPNDPNDLLRRGEDGLAAWPPTHATLMTHAPTVMASVMTTALLEPPRMRPLPSWAKRARTSAMIGALVANIYEVAKRAGVSPSTVSRVLSHHAVVAPATRRKVMA